MGSSCGQSKGVNPTHTYNIIAGLIRKSKKNKGMVDKKVEVLTGL
jgi:hypothetical protein